MNPTVLARAAIAASITPRFCEQALLPIIKRRLADAPVAGEDGVILAVGNGHSSKLQERDTICLICFHKRDLTTPASCLLPCYNACYRNI